MQILNTNYSVSPSNWTKKTPAYLKIGCDVLLFLSLVVGVLPEIPGSLGKWVLAGGAIAKLLSNFISDRIPITQVDQVSDPETQN